MATAPAHRLAENLVAFIRLLRGAGISIGTGQAIAAAEALDLLGLTSRTDVRSALAATLLTRADQIPIFDQAFGLFWQSRDLRARMMALLLPQLGLDLPPKPEEEQMSRRLLDALGGTERPEPETREIIQEVGAASFSANEALRNKDFETMSLAEQAAAKRALAVMQSSFAQMATRRLAPRQDGPRIDRRRSLRAALRQGGDLLPLAFADHGTRPRPIVALCDISGSMASYSRILLHFLHALAQDRDRVSAFLFGTRLTNVTREIRRRDVDAAVASAAARVTDWSGGTRIGACLGEFNRLWSRRVLGSGSVVLLITDGLDRDGGADLAHEADRLARSCHRLIWLNPLLRFDGFAPRAQGIKALLPMVDGFHPVHNLASIEALAKSLAAPMPARKPRPARPLISKGHAA